MTPGQPSPQPVSGGAFSLLTIRRRPGTYQHGNQSARRAAIPGVQRGQRRGGRMAFVHALFFARRSLSTPLNLLERNCGA